MANVVSFWAGENANTNALSGSGLGFYSSAGFGQAVPVGQWQGRTFITNAAGTAQGAEVDNVKYQAADVAVLGQAGSGIPLKSIPNERATLNVRFTADSAVRTQNAVFTLYDRVSLDNPAAGVTAAAYEISHQDTAQTNTGVGGPSAVSVSGVHQWTLLTPSGTRSIPLTASPGASGLRPSGSSTVDTRHDWYLALSVSPDTVGTKLFAGYVSLEFL
jgi:hypothetical protein